jgi:glycosyltransferase involved in cell wall biosynthesis
MSKLRVSLIVESGTDVRLVEGLSEHFDLSIVARCIAGGVEISQKPSQPVPVALGPPSRLQFAFFAFRHLRNRRDEIDFVLAQGYGLSALAANLACRLHRLKSAILVCSPAESYYRCRQKHPVEGKKYRRRELLMLRLVARLNALAGTQYFVLSDHLAEIIRGHSRRALVKVIPVYGVDKNFYKPSTEAKGELRRRLGLPENGQLVFFSSRIAPEKDSETLLSAIRILLDKGRDIWLLHRSGGYRSFLEDAARFGIAERVIAGDAVHPHRLLPQEYQACDLCVQASREEGLGFSPLEALACGIPVVATAVGGLKETIIDGKTGWAYPPGDSEGLADCIEAALDNEEESARRTALGGALVYERYERQHVFEMLVSTLTASDSAVAEPVRDTASKLDCKPCGH